MKAFLGLLCMLPCWLMGQPSTLQTPPLREGKYPKQEVEWVYPITHFLPAEKGYKRAERDFDAKGNVEQTRIFSAQSPITQVYLYESQPAQGKRDCYWKKNEGQRILEYTEYLSPQGKVLRRFRFRADGKLLDSLVYQYDAAQRIQTEKIYNAQGVQLYQTDFEYDDERTVCIEHHQDFATQSRYEVGITLDAQGQPLSRKRYDAGGQLLDKTEFIRNEQGYLIEKRYYRDGRTLETRELYDYDFAKGLVSWSVYAKGGAELIEYTVFEYNY